MAPHSSTLAWKIPWTEEPGRLWSMGSLRRIWLSDFTFTFHFHALEKEMATHSSVLAWRIPVMVEPGGLPSMGSHRVGHDWSELAAALGKRNPSCLWSTTKIGKSDSCQLQFEDEIHSCKHLLKAQHVEYCEQDTISVFKESRDYRVGSNIYANEHN